MTILKKIASLLLSLAIVITVLPTAALASALDFGSEVSPIDMVDFDTIGWTNEDMVYVPPEDELEAPIEALSIDILEANDNLYRVREEEEDVYTVVYRNSDTNLSTAYIFDYPVKYTDENGTIRDIDTDITPYLGRNNEIGYSSENNSIKVFYPKIIGEFRLSL